MKTIVLLLAIVLLYTASPLHAQNPVQDSIPQLKEWWRADNMQYGKYGMTWLDNFYNGKGALVVWTPNGVQTWQLRFPGDTQNVFTWSGGSAAIRTGDFNGDGITDYLDGKGNIYEGIQNGELPKSQPAGKGFYPDLVIDINGDGYDDMFYPEGYVLGGANLQELPSKVIKFPEIDSNNVVLLSYQLSTKEIRVLCRHYYWTNLTKYPFGKVYKEGLRLIGLRWEGDKFRSSILDEFTVPTPDSTGILYTGALLSQPSGKNYFICATMIKGTNQHTDVNVYDINNDKLSKLYIAQIDSISIMGVLQFSINNDTVPSWFLAKFPDDNGYSDVTFYSVNVGTEIKPIGKYTTCQAPIMASFPVEKDSQIAIAYSANHGWCFQVIKPQNTLNAIEHEVLSTTQTLIEIISPQPATAHQTIQIQLRSVVLGKYEISLYSQIGSKILTMQNGELSGSNSIINLSLSDFNLSKGVYWLTLKIGN
ncbi:MAG: hypothetical protein JST20_00980, partial [Bacteroidetes bacterium]|nr:hypothetical protein [Bacteroidota bacterium]